MVRKGLTSDICVACCVLTSLHFVPERFWLGSLDTLRQGYLPSSDHYVYLDNQEIIGFYAW